MEEELKQPADRLTIRTGMGVCDPSERIIKSIVGRTTVVAEKILI